MKSKFTKILCLVMGAILLVTGTVAVTLAYLKDETLAVTNTMSVGKVEIDLDEVDVDLDGIPVPNAPRVRENEYKLVPGSTYTKDPLIKVEAGSENCYVFFGLHIDESVKNVLDNNGKFDDGKDKSIFDQMAKNGWTRLNNGTNDVTTTIDNVEYAIYYYRTEVEIEGKTEAITLPTFESFTVRSDVEIDDNAQGEIKAMAFAIQSTNLDSVLAAWEAGWEQPNG